MQPLVSHLFDQKPHILRSSITAWLAESPRFAVFVEKYKDKIRKKIRVLNGDSMAFDLLAELETAYLLLAEKRFELSYEPYGGQRKRAPDFSVTWRTNLTFNLEVTRLHAGSSAIEDRLADTVCEKLGQMLPASCNILVVVGSHETPKPDVTAAMQDLKLSVEKRDPVLYNRLNYHTPGDFFKGFERLSGIVWRRQQGGGAILWNNPQSRKPLPTKVGNLLLANFSG